MLTKTTAEVLEGIQRFLDEQRAIAQLEYGRAYTKTKDSATATQAYYRTIDKAYHQLRGRIEGQLPYYK